MIKLNKNQRKFFEDALGFFKDSSNSVRLKDIREFAENNNLIIPTSALKSYCSTDKRGVYDLTKIGISVPDISVKPDNEDENIHNEISGEIMEMPAYMYSSVETKSYIPNNVVYVITFGDMILCAVNTIKSAWDYRVRVLHDHGKGTFEEFNKDIHDKGIAKVRSRNSLLEMVVHRVEVI